MEKMPDKPILIVDDAKNNRILLKAMLSRKGYQVEECEDGIECLEFCVDNPPALVLLDIMMPRMDGITACQTLRECYNKAELPVILCTAKSESSDIAAGLSAGANDYVVKPIDMIVLMARIESQLKFAETTQELEDQKAKAENALSIQTTLGNVLPEAIALTNSDDEVIYQNSEIEVLCGGMRPSNIDELFSAVCRGELREELVAANAEGRYRIAHTYDREFHIGGNDERYVQVISRLVETADDVTLRLWLWRDHTHTRLLEQKIKQQVKLNTVSLFATGVAHNFNNIMGGILGVTEILKRIARDSATGQRGVELIEKSVRSASHLIDKMLIISKHQIGVIDQPSIVVARLARAAFDKAPSELVKDAELVLEIDGDLPPVGIHPSSLEEALYQLMMNCLEAFEEPGVVTVRARKCVAQNCLEIVVEDDGVGISDEGIEHLYEPFYSTKSIDPVNKISLVGRGLGLWSVYNLVAMASGEVDVKSESGAGTQVRVIVPCVEGRNEVAYRTEPTPATDDSTGGIGVATEQEQGVAVVSAAIVLPLVLVIAVVIFDCALLFSTAIYAQEVATITAKLAVSEEPFGYAIPSVSSLVKSVSGESSSIVTKRQDFWSEQVNPANTTEFHGLDYFTDKERQILNLAYGQLIALNNQVAFPIPYPLVSKDELGGAINCSIYFRFDLAGPGAASNELIPSGASGSTLTAAQLTNHSRVFFCDCAIPMLSLSVLGGLLSGGTTHITVSKRAYAYRSGNIMP